MKNNFPKIILNSGKEHSLKRFHPWVFSGAIKIIPDTILEGDVVEVYTASNEYLGTGHFQKGTISVRIFSFLQTEVDELFWENKILKAFQYRKFIGLVDNLNTNAYRLVFGESDELPGLIIDFYNGTAVMQAHSIGMHLIRETLSNALKKVMGETLKAVYYKSVDTLPKIDSLIVENAYLYGKPDTNEILENGNKFFIDWENGQKTGFFLDQRDNRNLLSSFAKGKKILNTFCYSGGFSVYALNAGASEVHSVDSSQKAIDLTEKNILLNNHSAANHESFVADAFQFLNHKENFYDIIILDPPAFAKHRNVTHNAVMGYKRINAEAMRQIKPGGILFTFSCSQVIDKYLFNHTITSAAIQAGRNVKVLHYLSQPADHAVNMYHPEGEYLKGLVVYVE
ncbi:MAG: class I SAM-dependent rRNA methyltransferase [Bacteroidia bacterium]